MSRAERSELRREGSGVSQPDKRQPRREDGDAASGARPGFARALTAEWRKLASLASTWLTCAATAVLAALVAGSLAPRPDQAGQAVRSVADVAAAGFIVLGALASTGEHAGGQIHRSLLCLPRRGRLLAAKAAVTVCLGGVLAAVTMLACAWAAGLPASRWAFVVAGCIHLTALAAIAAAVGVILRGPVASLGTALVCLVVAPPLLRWSVLPTVIGQGAMEAALDGDGSAAAARIAALAAWTLAVWAVAAAHFMRTDA
ncbi:MAG: hypothetical protein Q3979_01660 [Actinomycetaceae bacterium]|nr:hypothetical protein [Actinomycetaceae bacterium]